MQKRSEVNPELTWDLTSLFKDETTFDHHLETLKQQVKHFKDKYESLELTYELLIESLEAYEVISIKSAQAQFYSMLNLSTDISDNQHNQRAAKVSHCLAFVNSELTFYEAKLLQLEDALLQKVGEKRDYARFIENLLKLKKHYLGQQQEQLLQTLSPVLEATMPLYNKLKLGDLWFKPFEVDGKEYPLSFVLYENQYDYELNHKVRKAAFKHFSEQLSHYQHAMAYNYNTHVQKEKIMSQLRGYDSVTAYLLDQQDVSEELYHRQLDLISEKFAPIMRKYVTLLKEMYGLDKMTFNDLKLVVDPEFEPKVSIDQARAYLKEGLALLGEDYLHMIDRAFDERWIDFVNNEGKSSGAFCASPYGSHPYVLISWTEKMREVLVLAHELGHAGNFYLAHQEQNYFNSRYSMYFVEAPSTMNELLMAKYLLSTSKDPRFKRWVYATMIARTYYHNFVTHIHEALVQRKVYNLVDQGQSINATVMNQLYLETLKEFWQDSVEIEPEAQYTWMRQQHYYKGLYPYTYSAGLTISTAMFTRLEKEGDGVIQDWLEVLKAGGLYKPVEMAKLAKIDITTPQPLLDTIDFIGYLVDEIERLTQELSQ